MQTHPRFHRRIAACLAAAWFAVPLCAQTTSVELVALAGGRIVGAARACGINPERIRNTSARLMDLVNDKAGSIEEKAGAARLFAAAQEAGGDEVRSARLRCGAVHVDFSVVEVKLGRRPDPPAAAKTPATPARATRPELAQGNAKP